MSVSTRFAPPAGPSAATRPPVPDHLRRRRRLLAWSAPVVALALLAGGVLLGIALGGWYGRSAYEARAYDAAATRFEHLKPSTVLVEPWKAWFNTGTALERAGEHAQAVEELRGAHRLVPKGTTGADGRPDPGTPECRVRINLSLTLESVGDDARGAGDPGSAVTYYRDAMDAIGPCTSDGRSAVDQPPQRGDRRSGPDETERRQRAKADRAERSQRAQGQPGQGDEQQSRKQAPVDPRQEQLEQRNQDAERDRQRLEQQRGGGTGSGQAW
ncbi:hypothetical protein [Georgenia thermotolerans]|uniref:Tetratricopeptide repeat protein n=1 Tax=Georgenia thermotolerans TaxID=527326 RepID=A0A7J5UK42_9MICO|nr:hypothetical protein [Georgenia thermotolerans]KAE8762752.1 hypothetical protein GB883_17720 [Georgenia thermotolerans]